MALLDSYLRMDEAADYLGVSRPTVYRLVDRGEIPAVYLPGIRGRRISRAALRKYVARRVPVPVRDDGLPTRSRSRAS